MREKTEVGAADARARMIDPTEFTPEFEWRTGRGGERLLCERVALEDVAKKVGTPAYVYSWAAIVGAYQRLDGAFGKLKHSLCYAVKANSNLSVLRVLARCGARFDV